MIKFKNILKEAFEEMNNVVSIGGPIQMKEAAPRMTKDPDVEKLMSLLKDVSRIENKIKSSDSSRYSHVKRDFKKFYDALINLKSTLNVKGPTIPQ
tara:strand:+ start:310 stop:597 length:288 start_codon:yes stop_codon:yes gene_type:complete